MAPKPLTDSAEQALRQLEESQPFHDSLVQEVELRRRQYEGVRERPKKQEPDWVSKPHPPYLNHIVETTVAGLLEDRLAFRIRPVPRAYNPGEYERAVKGARAHEILFRAQLKQDRFNEFQRPFVLDAAIVGMGVAKTRWRHETGLRKELKLENAAPPELAALGQFIPRLVETQSVRALFDGPETEAVDLRDFYWHEAAVSLDKARWCAHAIWMSMDDIQKLAKAGYYDQAAVAQLKDRDDTSRTDLELSRENRGRKKDMIECLEIWNRETGRVITLGAREVVLRERDWPFWHQQYPFVVSSLQPYPRSLRGMSMVQKLAHLQEMTWDLMGQRIDNTRFINNFIQILRSDVDDPDAFPFEPGAQWFMEDPQAVQQWAPNSLPAEVSLGAEALLKQDMQNLAGGNPFTSTSEARGVGADTATEAALVTNLAQMAVKQMKTQLFYGYERIGEQRMRLNQQFIRETVFVDTIGLDSAEEQQEILPELLQGDFLFDITPMNESLNRSEKRAEANGRFQTFIQSAAVLAAVNVPMNYKRLAEDLLEAWDVEDKEQYFSAVPQQPPAAQGGGPGGEAPATGQPAGVTGTGSIDPAVSPSNQASISPATFSARALASQGGVNNVG